MPEPEPRRTRPTTGRQRAAALRAERERRQRQRRLLLASAAAVLTVVLIVIVVLVTSHRTSKKAAATATSAGTAGTDHASAVLTGPAGPEGIALEQGTLLAPAPAAATGATIDGVQCNTSEQVVHHIHTHLTVYVNGQLRPIPGGVGMDNPGPADDRDR
jgi:hypothetical protein